jgi:TonB family protein
MQRILLLLCTIMLISGSAVSQSQVGSGVGAAPSASWRRYTVKDEEFSVKFPAYPVMLTSSGRRNADGKERLERHLRASPSKIYFGVKTYDNPTPRQSLEQFITEEKLNIGSDPLTERRLTIDGFAGIEYSSPNKDFPMIVQIFATEAHVYSFMVNGAGAADHAEEFFSSIKLGKKTDGLEVAEGPERPSPSDVGERAYIGTEVDVKVRLVSKPEPSYTEEARANRIEGVVVLKAIFARTGRVVNIYISEGLPNGLTEAAINAAKKIKFIPAMKGGQAVSMWIQLEYHFNL